MEGFILLNKPVGWTNRVILGYFKRITDGATAGHAGTLDPFAEGLMVMGIGRVFTRQLHGLLTAGTKEYAATIELGKASDTYDPAGTISPTGSDARPSGGDIRAIIESQFLGTHPQTPPVYSAKKFSGVRLRDIAHTEAAGALAAERTKTVTLYDYDILSYSYPTLTVRLSVSSGYYIRTFGNDLGNALGTGAYLTKLVRTRIDGFSLADALTPEELEHGAIETHGVIHGAMQGVGFRYFLRDLALAHGITGHAENADDGSVRFVAQGDLRSLSAFLRVARTGPSLARITTYRFVTQKAHIPYSDFSI